MCLALIAIPISNYPPITIGQCISMAIAQSELHLRRHSLSFSTPTLRTWAMGVGFNKGLVLRDSSSVQRTKSILLAMLLAEDVVLVAGQGIPPAWA
ncbi:hypothetical protein C5L39_10440 [Corynebacterium alimapuense]|uniref:Uncharacterized protein n=1 Tax=Corynebacterium alimapuense TaxID=1576874 RepID=A0A3M8K6R3_9CORY|nr:hypothetical protein C5L39_10440 [Corynebacterium alimapuense]